MDGTLFDSSYANVLAYRNAFEAAGLEFDEEKYNANFGLRFIEMMQQISPESSEEQRILIKQAKRESYKEFLDRVEPNHGLINLLRTLASNYKTALVTTASRDNVFNLLAHFDVDTSIFDCIITGEDVSNGKPDPECYIKAMEKLEVNPESCCIFEDSDAGVRAATNSGASVIRVSM